MIPEKNNSYKIILVVIGVAVFAMGIILFFIPPALFPDPALGFQVLRSMQMGSSFNIFVSPDRGDISQNYEEFLTWWSPGQYVIPWFFKLISGLNMGRAIASTVTVCNLLGLAGFYYFFKKIGFTPFIAATSLVFIFCQEAFMIPYVYYNGGEVLLFAFEGWYLYGCLTLKKPGLKLVLFVLLSGIIGFFLKSSFLWIYTAGLCFLWVRLCYSRIDIWQLTRKGLWIAIPTAISLAFIYLFFLSKGQNPASAPKAFKLTFNAFEFPLASPILSGFSVDDLIHGLIYYAGKSVFNPEWGMIALILFTLFSLLLVISLIRFVPNNNYRLVIFIFYSTSFLFFTVALSKAACSFEARHFRLIGILIVPGVLYLVNRLKLVYKVVFAILFAGIAFTSILHMINGLKINNRNARAVTGIAQPNIDQPSLNYIMKLDKENRNAIFVFISGDTGLEIIHNRLIALQPIDDDLKIDINDYKYDGHAGPLFIILPESYNGPKGKIVMKSFPGYKGFNLSMLSPNYVLCAAK